jgi:hypothetical protein
LFAGYDEDDSDALEFAELQTLCEFTALQMKKKRKFQEISEYTEKLRTKLDPHNEGLVPRQNKRIKPRFFYYKIRDRFVQVILEQMPELIQILIPESLLEVSEWSSVFRNVEQSKLSPLTSELFQMVQSGTVEGKRLKEILNKER